MTTQPPTPIADAAATRAEPLEPLSQARLAPALAEAIDAVRDATSNERWLIEAVALDELILVNGARIDTVFVRHQLGRVRGPWLDRWIEKRGLR
jgi:hypothetical protein